MGHRGCSEGFMLELLTKDSEMTNALGIPNTQSLELFKIMDYTNYLVRSTMGLGERLAWNLFASS